MLPLDVLQAKFIVRFPHFKEIFNRVDLRIDESIPTACTDGFTLFFNPRFMSSLTPEEQLFTFAHELLHVALEHIPRSKGKDMKKWNTATDAVINEYIKSCGIKQPEGLVDIKGALGYSAEELYEKLKEEEEKKIDGKSDRKERPSDEEGDKGTPGNKSDNSTPDENKNDSKPSDNGDGSVSSDEDENNDSKSSVSISPEDGSDSKSSGNSSSGDSDGGKSNDNSASEGSGDSKSNGSSSSGDGSDSKSSDGNSSSRDENKGCGLDDHSKWKEGLKRYEEQQKNGNNGNKKDIDEKEEFKKNDEAKERDDKDFVNNPNPSGGNEYGGMGYGIGNGNGGIREKPSYIGQTQMIPWQLLLKEAVKGDYDYGGGVIEVEDGVLVEPFERKDIPKTEIVIDSSGSISTDLIKNFLEECSYLINNTEAEVGFFGDNFSGFTRIRNKHDIDNIEIYNGQGTNFNAAVKAFTGRAENKIIFTDGEAEMPDDYCNAIWVVVGPDKNEIHPRGGRVIYITGEDYYRLCSPNKSLGRSR